eukprot:1228048-Alexandrium_andersonii.AAC.1
MRSLRPLVTIRPGPKVQPGRSWSRLVPGNLQKCGAPPTADPSSGGAARSAAPPAPASGKRGSEFLQTPSS